MTKNELTNGNSMFIMISDAVFCIGYLFYYFYRRKEL